MTTETQAIIVGGTSGIGLEVARKLAQQKVNLKIIARNEERLKTVADELAQHDIEVHTVSIDLYDKEQVSNFIANLVHENPRVKYLVNSAGYFKPVSFLEHDERDYDKQLNLNKALFFISQGVAKLMKDSGGGAIVNIGSMWAHQAVKATPSSAYSMQKAGLHSLTQHMAMELAEYNIRVNAVAPAVVVTPIYKAFIAENEIEDALTTGFNDFHPIGRVGRPEDVANAVEFLLNDKSSWVTGEILNVDGGVMSGRN